MFEKIVDEGVDVGRRFVGSHKSIVAQKTPLWRGVLRLASVFFVEVGVIVEFGVVKPEADFFFGFFGGAGSVNEVGNADAFGVGIAEGHVGVVATDGAHFGGFRLGGADDFADERDSLDAFENHGDDGTGHHVGDVVVEGLFAATGNHLTDVFVVSAVVVFGRFDHFHADDFEADAFEALEDFADETALDGVGL